MKKFFLLLIFPFIIANIQAQDYYISFAGTGASTLVDSVIIENMSRRTYISLPGDDILHLIHPANGLNESEINNNGKIKIFPNPISDISRFIYYSPSKGDYSIEILDISGKLIFNKSFNMEEGKQLFKIAGISAGVYLLSVKGESCNHTVKFISSYFSKNNINIEYIGTDNIKIDKNSNFNKSCKDITSIAEMIFSDGDTLKFTGFSGIYYAIVSISPAYDLTITFNFIPNTGLPFLTTASITSITTTTATSGGNITFQGGSAIAARGVCWDSLQYPDVTKSHTSNGSGTGSFISDITGLTYHTRYYVRAFAMNNSGINYGNQISFISAPEIPMLNTTAVTHITNTNATGGGNVTSDRGSAVTERGICWSINHLPTISDPHISDGTGTGSFTGNMTGLTAATLYYVRAYAINSAGIAYGDEVNFTSVINCPATMSDIDGNTYYTVVIGTQCWMKENLKTTRYRNGDSIPNVTVNAQWVALLTGAYCNYNNDTSYVRILGRLYNYYAVIDSGNICPTDWHVSSESDWNILDTYLGGGNISGGRLKDTGTVYWEWPNTGATNESGFTGLPGNERMYDGRFCQTSDYGVWWTPSPGGSSNAHSFGLYFRSATLNWYNDLRRLGKSIRCVLD